MRSTGAGAEDGWWIVITHHGAEAIFHDQDHESSIGQSKSANFCPRGNDMTLPSDPAADYPLCPVQPPAVDSTSGSSDSARPAEIFASAPERSFSLPSSSPSATRPIARSYMTT